MGKYSKGMRAWSEKQLAQFICRVFDEEIKRYVGPAGPPGAQGMTGPPGPPGVCQCQLGHVREPLAPWQAPIISYADGGRGYPLNPADTSIHVSSEITVEPDTYEGFSAVSVPYLCGCTWVGLPQEMAPEHCPTHIDSKRKRS